MRDDVDWRSYMAGRYTLLPEILRMAAYREFAAAIGGEDFGFGDQIEQQREAAERGRGR